MKRIIFRLWLVGAACWIALTFVALGSSDPQVSAQVAFVPPLIVFTIGSAVVWALGGFG